LLGRVRASLPAPQSRIFPTHPAVIPLRGTGSRAASSACGVFRNALCVPAYPQIRATKIGQWRIRPQDLQEFIKSRTNK